jgi:hypothetical protein
MSVCLRHGGVAHVEEHQHGNRDGRDLDDHVLPGHWNDVERADDRVHRQPIRPEAGADGGTDGEALDLFRQARVRKTVRG